MTERQLKLQKLRRQAADYASRLDRDRAMAAHPAGKGGAKPNGDQITTTDSTARVALHFVHCRKPECGTCRANHA